MVGKESKGKGKSAAPRLEVSAGFSWDDNDDVAMTTKATKRGLLKTDADESSSSSSSEDESDEEEEKTAVSLNRSFILNGLR